MTKRELRKQFDYLPNGTFRRIKSGQNRPLNQVVRGSLDKNGYRIICVNGFRTTISRAIYIWHFGNPKGQIDHKNRKRSDNRIENLRDVPPSVNSKNRRLKPSSNVYWSKGDKAWTVLITSDGKQYSGYFKKKAGALKRAKTLRKRLHGHARP